MGKNIQIHFFSLIDCSVKILNGFENGVLFLERLVLIIYVSMQPRVDSNKVFPLHKKFLNIELFGRQYIIIKHYR